MSRARLFATVLLLFATALAVAQSERSPTDAKAGAAYTNLEELAQRLVTQNTRVKEGEIVMIYTGLRDTELAENIATHVRKAGAFPLVALSSDRMFTRSFVDVPAKYDTQPLKFDLALVDLVDVVIQIDSSYAQDPLADIPVERRSSRLAAFTELNKRIVQSDMRYIGIGNGIYPTDWRAKRFGLSQGELARSFWQGVNVDYSDLQRRGEQIKSMLAAGKELRIKHSTNGSDLRVKIAGRPIIVSDGIISEADMKQGGLANTVYLPAGDIMTTPVPGTAQGKLVAELVYFDDKPVRNLTLNFVDGKATAMSGSGPGYDAFKKQFEATADSEKADFSYIDFGINDKIRLPQGSKVGTWAPAGIVTIGIGNNISFGGENDSSFYSGFHLAGMTVNLDGKTIIENGRLKL